MNIFSSYTTSICQGSNLTPRSLSRSYLNFKYPSFVSFLYTSVRVNRSVKLWMPYPFFPTSKSPTPWKEYHGGARDLEAMERFPQLLSALFKNSRNCFMTLRIPDVRMTSLPTSFLIRRYILIDLPRYRKFPV